ncbi:MAG: hypothetical protein N2511_07625, partial [Thermodesulfovibrionales bacterium]|nr:hypothetical protein [Thermodesulfovibrionales bacterium]
MTFERGQKHLLTVKVRTLLAYRKAYFTEFILIEIILRIFKIKMGSRRIELRTRGFSGLCST